MRAAMQFVSDLHLEKIKHKHVILIARKIIEAKSPDVCGLILAGDIGYKYTVQKLLHEVTPFYKHVVMVCGNHEFYNQAHTMHETFERLKELEKEFPGFKLLEKQVLTSEDIPQLGVKRILGTTLWSDISDETASAMNDGVYIHTERQGHCKVLLKPADIREFHKNAVEWLEKTMKPGDIVITHHAPSHKCINLKFGTKYSSGYASDLEYLVCERQPSTWIFGHTHAAMEFDLGSCQITSNPLGYLSEFDTGFRPGKKFSI
jgi:predicted phosphodiesterase